MADVSPYDSDPAALAWARAKVQSEIEHAERFAADLTAVKDVEAAQRWAFVARHLHRTLIGNEGPVMGRFDHRLPALHEACRTAPISHPADA